MDTTRLPWFGSPIQRALQYSYNTRGRTCGAVSTCPGSRPTPFPPGTTSEPRTGTRLSASPRTQACKWSIATRQETARNMKKYIRRAPDDAFFIPRVARAREYTRCARCAKKKRKEKENNSRYSGHKSPSGRGTKCQIDSFMAPTVARP